MNQEQRPRLRGLDVLQTRRTCPRKGRIIDRLQNEMVISVPAYRHTLAVLLPTQNLDVR